MENNNPSKPQQKTSSSEQLAQYSSQAINTTQFFVNEEKRRAFYFNNYLYIEQKKLGEGNYSDVYLFQNETNNSFHALKILKDNSNIEALIQELQIMMDVGSQFVIKIEEFIKIDDQLCIMMEYADQETLNSFILNISHQLITINENQILDIICDIFSFLNLLHSQEIILTDLKMDKLLVSQYQIKIGVGTYLISKSQAKTKVRNMQQVDQEKLNESNNYIYNFASDIFSAGQIILLILLGISGNEIVETKINQDYINQIQDSPEILKDFILKLIDKDPQSRPTAIEAFNQAEKLKYDQQVLDYIKSQINHVIVESFNTKDTLLMPNQSSSSLNNLDNSSLSTSTNQSNQFREEQQLFQKGMKQYCEANYESAEQCFSQILEKNLFSVEALAGKLLCGQRYQTWINKTKDYTNQWVMDQLKYIEQLNPNHYMYYYCQGVINNDIDSMSKCIELNPTMAIAIAYKGTLLIDQNKIEEAISLGQKALEISENNNFVLRLLGFIYNKINKDTSERYYLKSLAITPNDYNALYNLGTLYQEKNELEKALNCYNKSLSVCPYYRFSIQGKFNLMQVYTQQHVEVIEEIQSLFKQYGEQSFLYFLLATSYDEQGDYSHALLYYTKYLIKNDDCVDTLNNIAQIHKIQKDYQNARIFYQKNTNTEQKTSYIWEEDFNQLIEDLDIQEEGLDVFYQQLEVEFNIDVENECKAKIIVFRELENYEEFFALAVLALSKHPSSFEISTQIFKLIEKEDFTEFLPEQSKLAEMIENNQGISLNSTNCLIKCLKLNNKSDLVVSQILKYLEFLINKARDFDSYFNYPTYFKNYIIQENLQQLYERIQKLRESYPNNFNCYVIFISLMTIYELKFSNEMLEEIERTCYQNKLFEEYEDQDLVHYLRISFKGQKLMQYYLWRDPNETKIVLEDFFNSITKADITVKKRFALVFELSYKILGRLILRNKKIEFSSKELDFYQSLLSSIRDEGIQLHPDLADEFM